MATADELLANLATHTHRVSDSDTYYIIDPVTRKLDNSSSIKNVLMQFDHDSEIFTFEIPRIVEGHDMMLCNAVKVHFNNIDAGGRLEYTDVYDVTDLKVDPNDNTKVLCSWTISRHATQYAGSLNFLVQYACVQDGEIVYEWHTDIYSNVEIREGRNNGEASVMEYTDLLEQWRERLFGEQDSMITAIQSEAATQIAEIEAKTAESLSSIPEDYTTTHNMADEALRRKADAVIVSESGKAIVLDDSSDNNLIGLNLYGKTTQVKTTGKNLLNVTAASQTINGVSFVVNADGSITVNGTATANNYFLLSEASLDMGEYYLSGCTGGNTTTYLLYAQKQGGADYFAVRDGSVQFKVEDDEPRMIMIAVYKNTRMDNVTFYPMIRQISATDDSYESYSEGKISPSPDYPQNLISIENPKLSISSNNFVDIHSEPAVILNSTYAVEGNAIMIASTAANEIARVEFAVPYLAGRTYMLSFDATMTTGINSSYCPIVYMRKSNVYNGTIKLISDGEKHRYSLPILLMEDGYKLWLYVKPDPAVSESVSVKFENIQLTTLSNTVEYETYKPVQNISLTHTLRGIPVRKNGNYIDANGQQWTCDEIDFERGKFIQRVKQAPLTLTHGGVLDSGNYYAIFKPNDKVYSYPGAICTMASVYSSTIGYEPGYFYENAANIVFIGNPDDTIEAMQERYTDAEILYVLATPIETNLTAVEMEAFRALHTNATNTTILNDQNADVTVKYNADLKRYIYKNVSVKEVQFNLTLVEANWVESSDGRYYSQVLNLGFDVRPNSRINFAPTAAQQVNLILDGIAMFVANENGVVTAYAIGGTPGRDVTYPATETVVVYA